MLSDQAVTYPVLYQKYLYLVSKLTNDVPPLPMYKILVYGFTYKGATRTAGSRLLMFKYHSI